MAKTKESFEASFTGLEQVVAQLQEGGLTLEESLALYERGMSLAKECSEQLDKAELRVLQLAGGPAPRPYAGRPEDPAAGGANDADV